MNEHPLSPKGLTRRQQIKDACARQVPAIRWRRRAMQSSARAVMVLGLFVCAGLVIRWNASLTSMAERTNQPVANVPSPSTESSIVVKTNPPWTEATPAQPIVRIESIDNDRLLKLLAEAGQPSSLGRIDGKLVVLPSSEWRDAPRREPRDLL
jgi:hypothetical protein